MTNFLEHKVNGLKMRLKWYRYGVTYFSSSDCKVPKRLLINGSKADFKFINSTDPAFIYEFTEICINDCYRLKELKKRIPKTNTIVDVGANQGLFLIAARQSFPKAFITGYEPNRNLKSVLQNNATALKAAVYYEAVTDKACRVQINFQGSDLYTTVKENASGDTPGTSLAEVIERAGGHIDILKLDCEGGEWSLLDDSNLWNKITSVTMEYHLWAKAGSSVELLTEKLRNYGFEIISLHPLSDEFGILTAIKI